MKRINAVKLSDFPPFGQVDCIFHETNSPDLGEVHLITGKNGTGKTRLLCLLAASLGNPTSLNNRRARGKTSHSTVIADFHRRVWSDKTFQVEVLPTPKYQIIENELHAVGGVTRSKDGGGFLGLNVSPIPPQNSKGLGLAFKGTNIVGDPKVKAMETIEIGKPLDQLNFDRQGSNSTNFQSQIVQGLANICTGASLDQMEDSGNSSSRDAGIKNAIERVLSNISGKEFRFRLSREQNTHIELAATWGGQRMRLHHLPDGIRSIIGWLAGCVVKLDTLLPDSSNPLKEHFFLLLDEPELHLHPEWQWRIIPATQQLFPNAQIFVATHSPFVVASANEGWIHVLETDQETDLVEIKPPIPCQQGDTFLDAAEDILGIRSWYDPETEQLISAFKAKLSSVRKSRGEGFDELKTEAANLASLGRSLSNLVGSEMAQLEKQLEAAVAKT